MKAKMKESIDRISTYLIDRYREIYEGNSEGPGNKGEIYQITLGFEFDQSQWVSLVPDYRYDAEIDGEWNSYIEENILEMPEWRTLLQDDSNCEEIASLLGTLLQQALSSSLENPTFSKLNKSPEVLLTVEHHDGAYAWSNKPIDGQSSEEYLESLDESSNNLSNQGKVNYWIGVLTRVSTGEEENNNDWGFLALDHVIKRLQEISDLAIDALLDFLIESSNKVEFIGDRPEEGLQETPVSSAAYTVLYAIHESGVSTENVRNKLINILKNSISVNEPRILWGTVPAWTARCLNKLFPEYDNPVIDDSTNKLINSNCYV